MVRTHERHAARWREEAARAKLAAKDAAFQQKLRGDSKKNKRKREPKAASTRHEDADGDLSEEDDELEDDSDLEDGEDNDEETLHARREAELERLRQEVQAAEQAAAPTAEQDEEALRQQLLQDASTAAAEQGSTAGFTLQRKERRRSSQLNAAASSLIANMTHAATPPHDFSEKLELTVVKGKVLFPSSHTADQSGRVTTNEFQWSPPEGVFSPNDGALEVELPDFDVARAETGQGNNTVAIKFTAPADSRRFSINIARGGADNDSFNSVLFHFNPRSREHGGKLVVNDKQDGMWGQAINIPLSQLPLMFGQTACTLLIQINGEGFDIFLENQHCARLEHRKELPAGPTNLVLQFPSTDDSGKPENWTVYKVWWGNKAILANKGDVSGVPGVNNFNSVHPRKIFISGLGKISTQPEVDIRRAELERAFRPYGGDRGVECIVPTNATYAFVEMESERMADLALQEMAAQYRMNRARRSRHDALQEERAAAEAEKLMAAGGGGGEAKKKDSAWD